MVGQDVNNLTTVQRPPFLDGIAEMDADVSQMGEGTTKSNVMFLQANPHRHLINNSIAPNRFTSVCRMTQ
jgi:hypothetical protein